MTTPFPSITRYHHHQIHNHVETLHSKALIPLAFKNERTYSYYNASILSNVLVHRENINDVQGIEELKQISPVAWQHINLYGRYEFRKFSDPINLDDIVQQLTQAPSH